MKTARFECGHTAVVPDCCEIGNVSACDQCGPRWNRKIVEIGEIGPNVQHTTRQVIEDKLLTDRIDAEKVNIICTKYDIETLERALELGMEDSPSRSEHDEFCRFLDDIRKLKAVLK